MILPLLWVKHTLQSSEIFNCLIFTWIPEPNYDFPLRAEGKHNRKFQYKYLEIFLWLAFSEIKKGAYCKWCCICFFRRWIRQPGILHRKKIISLDYL